MVEHRRVGKQLQVAQAHAHPVSLKIQRRVQAALGPAPRACRRLWWCGQGQAYIKSVWRARYIDARATCRVVKRPQQQVALRFDRVEFRLHVIQAGVGAVELALQCPQRLEPLLALRLEVGVLGFHTPCRRAGIIAVPFDLPQRLQPCRASTQL